MKLLLNLRRKSARCTVKQSESSSDTDDVKSPSPSPSSPPTSPSFITVSRCASLTSMDSMAAALALTPVTLNLADSISRSSMDVADQPATPVDVPASPRVAPLVATVGPTVLRSNLCPARNFKKPRRPKTAAGKRMSGDIGTSFGTIRTPASPASKPTVSGLPELVTSSIRRKSGSGASSSTSTPLVVTPADLTPFEELPPAAFDSVVGVPNPSKPSSAPLGPPALTSRRRSSAEETKECFAPVLASKASFSPTRLTATSPTGSCFGVDSLSPTFSYFHSSEGCQRRSLGSLFASDDSPVDVAFGGHPRPSPTWSAGDVFGGAFVLLDSPTSDVHVPVSPFRSTRTTSPRLAERRPINLDLSAASRRPHPRQVVDSPVFKLPSTVTTSPKALSTPPITPETAESMANQQDGKQATSKSSTATTDDVDVTLHSMLRTPPETPLDHKESLPRVRPLNLPPLMEVNEVKEYRKGMRKLPALVEGASPP